MQLEYHSSLHIDPMPTYMHPEHHVVRSTVHVDVAEYPDREAFSIGIVSSKAQPAAAASINAPMRKRDLSPWQLATLQPASSLATPKQRSEMFPAARLAHSPFSILRKQAPPILQIQIIWVPAHSYLPRNEAAYNYDQGFFSRAVGSLNLKLANERIVTNHDITMHYRNDKQAYPPPHRSLDKVQEVAGR